MADIVLVAIHASYIHPPFGLFCLKAALGTMGSRCRIVEFTNKATVDEMVEALVAEAPRIVGFGVYLWNREKLEQVATALRPLAPQALLVAGGPEITGCPRHSPLRQAFHTTIDGEGEIPFRDLCARVLDAEPGPGPDDAYDEYTDHDLEHRLTYVEASRGCAYRCSFCTSASHPGVEHLPLGLFFASMETLLARGARRIKFLDRSFNLDIGRACAILDFFLDRPGDYFVHFELVPDRLPPELRYRLGRFRPGSLRLEVGVQTLDPVVSAAVHRPLNPGLVLENLKFLAQETTAIVHVDLIAGLPGETLEGFSRGVDTLWSIWGARPGTEVQLGILKRLPGTPLDLAPPAGSRFRETAPYDLLASPELTEADLVLLNHAARLWERIVNRSRFPDKTAGLLGSAEGAFGRFLGFTRWFVARHGRSWGIALEDLGLGLVDYLR